MEIDESLSKLADIRWLKPLFQAATRAYLQFRPFVLHLDIPGNAVLSQRVDVLQGWFLARASSGCVALQIAGVRLTSVAVERPDAERIFGPYVRGFRAIADMAAIEVSSLDSTKNASLDLLLDGKVVASKPLHLLAFDPMLSKASVEKRVAKREWLKTHVACPRCESRADTLEFNEGDARCRNCGTAFNDDGKVLDFLPDDFKRRFQLAHWVGISAHDYDETAKEVIEQARAAGGKVLDCGSGLRGEVDETVICLEVDAFPNVDILGVNQRLPFKDAVFDAVLSLNVLEHVTDPFACAGELARVLKPGGTLYCCIPFLQPEHGYPDHYFNATGSGLRQLFASHLELIRHFVPASGEPVWSLHWFLSWYLRELPPAQQPEFLKMRVENILADSAQASLGKPWVAKLSEAGKWSLASSTAAVFKKPLQTSNYRVEVPHSDS